MLKKIKEFYRKYRLLLITLFTLVIAILGVFEILVSAKSHAEFWPAVGSWIGGVATVYGVCIAIVEYLERKRLSCINEKLDLLHLVKNELYTCWYSLSLFSLEATCKYFTIVKFEVESQEKKSKRDFEEAFKLLADYEEKFSKLYNKLCYLESRLKVISSKDYSKIEQGFDRIHKLSDNNYGLSGSNLFPSYLSVYASEFAILSDKIASKYCYDSIIDIQSDPDWEDYMQRIKRVVFISFVEELENI